MDPKERSYQFRVGIFLALGLAAVAAMVVYFGRFGEGIRKYYDLRVEFPNASGLLNGASVLLAGAKVGSVASPPAILPDMQGVFVELKIYDGVLIPQSAEFRVGSSGLLGDRFVEILPGKDAMQSPPIAPGSTVRGRGQSGGFSELADSAASLLDDVQEAVRNINAVAQKLDREVLAEPAIAELKATFANLERASSAFAEASAKFDSLLDRAGTAVATGDSAMASAKSAADELRRTLADARNLLDSARKGGGVLGALLSDKQMADNLRALAANLRRYGILFYRDAG
ncbi:MAG: MlaD family protein, partial [Terrimicrobiaceae bacterium]|nr:MlaD family protein [Terrimicrobiaceae bacterium]